MKKIKKECLFEILLTKLTEMQHVTRVYIGKTNDIEQRDKQHKMEDGYPHTVEIAHGEPKIISEAEKYMIGKFENVKDANWTFCNKSDGGEGNSNASILYISYDYDCSTMKCDADVNDDVLDIDSYELN